MTDTQNATVRVIEESAWRAAWTKFPFLATCWASLLIVGLIEGLIFYLIHPRLNSLNERVDLVIGIGLLFFLFIVFSGLFLITLTSLTGIDFLYPHNKKSITVKMLFPISVMLGQFIGINRNRLRTSFVKVNNSLTQAQSKRIKGEKILILLPHCLQIDVCQRKITNDVNNCVQCGRCPVGELIAIGNRYGLKIEVVNGGTLARRRVASLRPDGIIAVAC
jgi:hypothetical protein